MTDDNQNNTIQDQKELEEDFIFDELEKLDDVVENIPGVPPLLQERLEQILRRLNRMAKLGHYSSEFDTQARYIETIAEIPWQKMTEDRLDIEETARILNSSHYGMDDVKERILEYMATLILIQQRGGDMISRTPVLLFVGLQGVGNTRLFHPYPHPAPEWNYDTGTDIHCLP